MFITATTGIASLWWHLQSKKHSGPTILPFRGLTAYLAVQLFSAAVVIVAFSTGPHLNGLPSISRIVYFFGYSGAYLAGLTVMVGVYLAARTLVQRKVSKESEERQYQYFFPFYRWPNLPLPKG
jgi:hypothetical protein